MSRTYRRSKIDLDDNHKPYPGRSNRYSNGECHYGHTYPVDYYSKNNQKYDNKPWYKAPHDYKKLMNRIRRAREQQAMKNKNYDNVPIFKKENDWHWT